MKITAKWTFNNFDQIVPAIEAKVSLAVRKTAFDIEAGAKARTPVDTGALRSSIHIIIFDKSSYPEAIEQAAKLYKEKYPTRKEPEFLSEEPTPKHKLKALVAVAINYGWFIENGTSKQPAKPFLAPAAMAANDSFIAAVKAAVLEGALQVSR